MNGEQYTDYNQLYEEERSEFICKTWWFCTKEQLGKIEPRKKFLETTYVPEHLSLSDFAKLANMGLPAFMIAKYYDCITPNAIRAIADNKGIVLSTCKNESLYEQQSSPFRVCDTVGIITWYMQMHGLDLKGLAGLTGIKRNELYYIISEIKIPTKEQLEKIVNVLKTDIPEDILRKISKDADAILSDSLSSSAPRYVSCLINQPDSKLGEWGKSKEVIVLSHLAAHRIKNGYSIAKMSEMLQIYSNTYLNYELCRKTMPTEIARKLVFILRLKDYENLYICEKLPINYHTYLWRYYLYGKQ